jgi:hypothetical protein
MSGQQSERELDSRHRQDAPEPDALSVERRGRHPEKLPDAPLAFKEQQRRFGGAEAASDAQLTAEGQETPVPEGELARQFGRDAESAVDRQLEWDRLEYLSRKRGLTREERHELSNRLDAALDATDPHSRESDRLTAEGKLEFERAPEARREFSHLAGTEEHKRWEEQILLKETAAGRLRGIDFDLEAILPHGDGGSVRLDYVDYRNDVIIDRKPLAEGETEDQLQHRYREQRTRHIEAYEQATGRKVAEYRYSVYPSPRDL